MGRNTHRLKQCSTPGQPMQPAGMLPARWVRFIAPQTSMFTWILPSSTISKHGMVPRVVHLPRRMFWLTNMAITSGYHGVIGFIRQLFQRICRGQPQADCLAGIWMHHAVETGYIAQLTDQDIEQVFTLLRRLAMIVSSGRRRGISLLRRGRMGPLAGARLP